MSSYSQFSSAVQGRVSGRRVPLSGTIEVTRRCPLACAHCYNNLPMNARTGELTLDEHCRILDEIAEAGCFWLLYTGGEIFGRRDFLDIYRHAKARGFLITLFTNATLINPCIADGLAAERPFSIEVTLYGGTRDTYERVTGVPGSFDHCLRGISLMRERNLPVSLKTVALTMNVHEIEAMRGIAAGFGLPFKFDAMMSPRIDCGRSPLAVRLSPEQIVSLDMADDRRRAEWQRLDGCFHGPVHTAATEGQVYHCGGGVNTFAIDPEGRLTLCVLSHMDSFDLRAGAFAEGWERFLLKVRTKPASRVTKCSRCEIRVMCGMCPANGELENGDAESPVDFLCHVAHLRAHAMGFAVAEHGNCEYCPGGSRHAEMKSSAERLRGRLHPAPPAPQLFRVIQPQRSAGGLNG